MADLIGRIARSRNDNEFIDSNPSSNDSRILSLQRSRGLSFGLRGWNRRESDRTSTTVGFNDITRPDAIYTVNATTNNDVETGLHQSKDIYTTREFRVDYEEMSQPQRTATGSNTASSSRRENEDASLLKTDEKDYIVTDDTPR